MLAVRNIFRSLLCSKYLKTITVTTMEALRKTEKEISIKAPWGNIAALTWGNPSDPPVLLCHGKQDACSGFRPLVSLLPKCFYYVSIDLPGNGRSDHLPPGVRYSAADLVPSILNTVKHFNFKKFIYIGHSLGVPVGKLFNIAYPGYISRTVELDPIPAHHTWPSTQQGLQDWYHRYYTYYDDVSYAKHNGGAETAPKYTFEKISQKHRMSYRLGNNFFLIKCAKHFREKEHRTFLVPKAVPRLACKINMSSTEKECMQNKENFELIINTTAQCLLARDAFPTAAIEDTFHRTEGTLPYYSIRHERCKGNRTGVQNNRQIDSRNCDLFGKKAQNLVMSSRNLSKEAAGQVLERCLEPAGEGLYRFTFDQRMKEVTILPFSSETLQQIYTSTKTPTFCVLSKKILEAGLYDPVPFLTDESSWPNGNYKFKVVEGWHDVHIEDPASMADDIAKFLLEDLKAKL